MRNPRSRDRSSAAPRRARSPEKGEERDTKPFERTEMLLRSGKKLITACPSINPSERTEKVSRSRKKLITTGPGEEAPEWDTEMVEKLQPRRKLNQNCPGKRTEKVSSSRKKYTEMDEELQPIRKLNPNCPSCSGKGSSSNVPEWCDYCQKRMRGLVHPQVYAGGKLFGVCRRLLTLPADGKAPYRQRVKESRLWINGVLVCENGVPVPSGREEAKGDQAVDAVEELQN